MTRARLLYIVMSIAFGGLAVAAVVIANAAVTVVAVVAAVATLGLAVIAPRLSATRGKGTPPTEVGGMSERGAAADSSPQRHDSAD